MSASIDRSQTCHARKMYTVTRFKFQTRNPGKLPFPFTSKTHLIREQQAQNQEFRHALYLFTEQHPFSIQPKQGKRKKRSIEVCMYIPKKGQNSECVIAENNPKTQEKNTNISTQMWRQITPQQKLGKASTSVYYLFILAFLVSRYRISWSNPNLAENIVSYGFASLSAILFLKPCSWNNNQPIRISNQKTISRKNHGNEIILIPLTWSISLRCLHDSKPLHGVKKHPINDKLINY